MIMIRQQIAVRYSASAGWRIARVDATSGPAKLYIPRYFIFLAFASQITLQIFIDPMGSYYDIDAILTDAHKLPCTFEIDIPGLGYLEENPGGDVLQSFPLPESSSRPSENA